jgi:hypothetical protein
MNEELRRASSGALSCNLSRYKSGVDNHQDCDLDHREINQSRVISRVVLTSVGDTRQDVGVA